MTIVSRCQRFDLSRVKSEDLFQFIKKVKDKENGNVSDEALKLIVKISEGSVRDALSLLDRCLLSLGNKKELNLSEAQKIFGYFDKSQLIEMFNLVLLGDEKKVLELYKKIFDQDVKFIEKAGLWNGGMHYWITIFVEIEEELFTPVKNICDLYLDIHQP